MRQPHDRHHEDKEDRREQIARECILVETIVEAAARVFDAHGYDGANTNEVARVAGVSVGSVCQYFPNKDALVTALHERHVRHMLRILDQVGAAAGALRRAISDAILGYLTLAAQPTRAASPTDRP
ncbi:TetR/AcrR family transcriptional regulator [Sorangium sp. So ce590]|uniref:TetR/AcrR family transcriptional regulator n=1 Tax=unclassified Sorangium TaxID=2621164 RepID=UPI003F6364E9